MDTRDLRGLLSLPRELRDEIHTYLIFEPTLPPLSPSAAGRRLMDGSIMYQCNTPIWRYSPIVWTCRQLRHEYFSLITELLKSGHLRKAEIDIMAKGSITWPTWTFLPPYLPQDTPIDLNVRLRIFSAEGFRINDGWPRQMGTVFRDLFSMLKSFLNFGPTFMSTRECLPSGLPAGWLPSAQYDAAGLDSGELPCGVPQPNSSFKINTLSLHIAFHDDYHRDSRVVTIENILMMLQELAVSGVAKDVIRTVHMHVSHQKPQRKRVFDKEWTVADKVDEDNLKNWIRTGFMSPGETLLCNTNMM